MKNKEEKKKIKIPLVKIDSDNRYIDSKEKKWDTDFRNDTYKEYQKLLYVELPSLINRIVNTRVVPVPLIKELVPTAVNEIAKVTTTECNTIIDKYESYLKKPLDEVTSNDLKN